MRISVANPNHSPIYWWDNGQSEGPSYWKDPNDSISGLGRGSLRPRHWGVGLPTMRGRDFKSPGHWNPTTTPNTSKMWGFLGRSSTSPKCILGPWELAQKRALYTVTQCKRSKYFVLKYRDPLWWDLNPKPWKYCKNTYFDKENLLLPTNLTNYYKLMQINTRTTHHQKPPTRSPIKSQETPQSWDLHCMSHREVQYFHAICISLVKIILNYARSKG